MKRSEYMAIKPQFLSKYARRYDQAIEAGYAERVIKMAQEDIDDQFSSVYRKENGVGIINLAGPMSEDGPDWLDLYLGYSGVAYKNLIRAAEEAARDDDVKTVRVNGNTPGGNIDGLESAFQSLEFLAQKKEVIAYNYGMIASAGVWYTAAAQKVIAANPAAMIGSIGVVVDTLDFSGYYEGFGIKEITITNSASPNKRPDLTKSDGRAIMVKELDALFGVFVQRVTDGRTIGADGVKKLKGEMVIAADAVKIGLMDGIEGEKVAADSTGSNAPAAAEKSNKENLTMDEDVKKQFEALNSRFDKLEAGNKAPVQTAAAPQESGLSAEDKKFALNIIQGASYPSSVTAEAGKVLAGESTMAELKGMVAGVDAAREINAGQQAAGETTETGETKPEGKVVPEEEKTADSGPLDSKEAIAAERARIKGEA